MPKVEQKGRLLVVSETYDETRERYLRNIRDAQDLGETDELTRLQNEWKQKKQQKFGK